MGRASREMVERQLVARGIADARVLEAMRRMPRGLFVPREWRLDAHRDRPLPIGLGQTISQPYIVALMLEAAAIAATDRVLDVGAGSGYTAALLSLLAARVFAIERHEGLLDAAVRRWRRLGLARIEWRCGDGSLGWPEAAPFDAIVVGAGGPDIPPALREQLAPGGRLVMPIGREGRSQELVVLRRDTDGGFRQQALCAVRFVPLVGAQGWRHGEG